jgi:hypothetical protein
LIKFLASHAGNRGSIPLGATFLLTPTFKNNNLEERFVKGFVN